MSRLWSASPTVGDAMRATPQARYILPEFRERTAQGERVHNPYTKLFEERIIFLGVQIDDASADDVMAQLLCLESMDPDRDISIYINSPGGSYTAMTAIYDTMQFIKPRRAHRLPGAGRIGRGRCCWPPALPASVRRCRTRAS